MIINGQFLEIDDNKVHYVKVGSGPLPLLMLPGGMGHVKSDFEHQLCALDKSEFTMIAMDPVGYGLSIPPKRTYKLDMFKKDGEVANKLMNKLGYKTYSVLGWSDGAKVGLIMAIQYPSVIEKLVVLAGSAFFHPSEIAVFKQTRDIKNWNPDLRGRMEKCYGDDLQSLWARHIDNYIQLIKDGLYICKNDAHKIRCPTFAIHGDADPLISLENILHLEKQIPDVTLHRFPKGLHHMHQQYPEEVNKLVQNFLLEED